MPSNFTVRYTTLVSILNFKPNNGQLVSNTQLTLQTSRFYALNRGANSSSAKWLTTAFSARAAHMLATRRIPIRPRQRQSTTTAGRAVFLWARWRARPRSKLRRVQSRISSPTLDPRMRSQPLTCTNRG